MAYKESEARELIIRACGLLVEKRLVARTWGNISARTENGCFVITPSGRAYETLRPEDLVVVQIADCGYDGDVKPSSEKGIHAEAYKIRKNVNFVIHTHQFFASALAAGGLHAAFAPCAAYGLPGTKAITTHTGQAIFSNPGKNAFLLEKHGALLLGRNFDDAFLLASALERDSEALFRSRVPLRTVPDTETVTTCEKGTRIEFRNSFTAAYAQRCKALPAYIDDFAQLFGQHVSCVQPCAKESGTLPFAVLRRDGTAVCAAPEEDDARAMAAILTKNCAAALYASSGTALSVPDTLLQRAVYTLKYSKLKNNR